MFETRNTLNTKAKKIANNNKRDSQFFTDLFMSDFNLGTISTADKHHRHRVLELSNLLGVMSDNEHDSHSTQESNP